jgi:biotin carboxylase
MKKTVVITGAGGVGGIAFARSLHEADTDFFLCGLDSNQFNLQRAETDEKILIPNAKAPNYIEVLIEILQEVKADYLQVQTSHETLIISENRKNIPCMVFIPSHETIKVCASKFSTFQLWQKAGIKVAQTIFINNEDDLSEAFKNIGKKLWLRFNIGSSGAGALPTTDYDMARAWINFHNGWKLKPSHSNRYGKMAN